MSEPSPRPPRIGIAPLRRRDSFDCIDLVARCAFLDAVRAAGGLCALLAGTDAGQAALYLDGVDGLLLPGGDDIHPRFYGQEPEAELSLEDDDVAGFQLALARAAWERDLPVLGVCLGCQVLAVARGGSLIQHLGDDRPGAVAHRRRGGGVTVHGVSIEPGSQLNAVLGVSQLDVSSHHHQAVATAGDGLEVTAVAPDAVVEGLEDPSRRFFLGVQWHAERGPESAADRRLFASLVRAARSGASEGTT